MPKNKIWLGALAVATAALLWSLDGTFFRPQLYSLPSVFVVFLEHSLGFIALLPFLIIYRAQLKEINKKQWATIFWVALFGGALGTTFITKALFLTGFHDISVVILLQKFQPLFAIALAAIFLRERFPKKFYLYAAIALMAGYFVTFKDPWTVANAAKSTLMVAAFSLLAAFAWGSSTTFGKYSLKNIHFGLLAALRFGLTILIMAAPALYYYSGQFSIVSGKQWLVFLGIVFSSGALAMYLYYYGLKKIPASLAALCELAWPVSAVIFDYFINHNVLSATQIIGALILIAAVYRVTALNRSYTIEGIVQDGAKQGGKLGSPTANLDVTLAGQMPKGLYACEILIQNPHSQGDAGGGVGCRDTYSGLLYYGYNSLTRKDCLEAHILDFGGDLYGQKIIIITDRYLRLPKKFKSSEDLSAQIEEDKMFLRNI